MHSFGGFFYFLFGAFYFHKTKFYLVINNFRFAERRSVVFYMKKNNKFRNNNYNNQILSLNYRFDSISSAGKCSGTALDLIKRYNELAKEAQGNGDLVEAEVFRQYAEHYRKIVTEINERKSSRFNNQENEQQSTEPADVEPTPSKTEPAEETKPALKNDEPKVESSLVETKPKASRKSFKVIEIAGDASADKSVSKTKKAK